MAQTKKVKIGQPYTLTLDTNKTLSGASATNIEYRKPDGTTGTLTGSITDTTKIQATVTGAINDIAGLWFFEATATFSGDATATRGETAIVKCKALWE